MNTYRLPRELARRVDAQCELDALHEYGARIDRRIARDASASVRSDRVRPNPIVRNYGKAAR